MYRKLHHKFLQNFPVVDVSQVVMCVTSQINERVTRQGSFAKGFAMSFDSQNTIKKKKNLLDQMEAINPLNHFALVENLERMTNWSLDTGEPCGGWQASFCLMYFV
jgi:hypothetical protein